MQPTDVDPGVKLAGRYRVSELLAESPVDGRVARTWLAIDEVLSRPVVVHLLDADDPRTPGLLAAARHAATVSDVRFLRVLDALTEDGIAYVVKEWSAGRSLATLLASGPLDPSAAGWLVREIAEALAGAHTEGLAHLRLGPDSVLVTDMGAVRIVGLATDAALTPDLPPAPAGVPGAAAAAAPVERTIGTDLEQADAKGLGRLLYAGLTARWPAGERAGLRAAPSQPNGVVLSPRQCRAGVPRLLDEITERILERQPRQGLALRTPQEVSAALADAVGVMPHDALTGTLAPGPAGEETDLIGVGRPYPDGDDDTVLTGFSDIGGAGRPSSRPNGSGPDTDTRATWANGSDRLLPGSSRAGSNGSGAHRAGSNGSGNPQRLAVDPDPAVPDRVLPPPGRYRPARAPGPRWGRIIGLAVAVLLLSASGLVGWQLSRRALDTAEPSAPTPRPSAHSATAAGPKVGTPYPVAAVDDFDPPPGNGEEHPDEVGNADDGDPSTSWQTMEYYGDAHLGNLKPGVGLSVDLGRVRTVGSVVLDLFGDGTDLQLRAAPAKAADPPAAVKGWRVVGSASDAGQHATIALDKPVRARYLLIWLTKLPPEGGQYRGGVSEVVVRR